MENGVGMTNVLIFKNTNTTARLPDIICLQEVYDPRLNSNNSDESKSDKEHMIKSFFTKCYNNNNIDNYAYHAQDTNAIMYDKDKFKFIYVNKIVREYDCEQKIKDKVKSSMYIKFECNSSKQQFFVACVHLKAGCELSLSNNDLEWSNIIRKLLVHFFNTPVFICGDFNRDPKKLNTFIRQDGDTEKHLFTLVSNNEPTQFPTRMRSAKQGFDYIGKQILKRIGSSWTRTIDGIFYDATKCEPSVSTIQTISMNGISDHDLLQCEFHFF